MSDQKIVGGAKISGTGFYTPPGGEPVPIHIEGTTTLTPEELEEKLGVPVTVKKESPDGNA